MKTVRTWCIRILMILFTIIFLYPLFWNLMSAFKTNAEYLTDPYALPVSLNLDNFVAAWQKGKYCGVFWKFCVCDSAVYGIASAVCHTDFLCTGKIPFCRKQTDLDDLYGMYFPPGNVYHDPAVSGITGDQRAE